MTVHVPASDMEMIHRIARCVVSILVDDPVLSLSSSPRKERGASPWRLVCMYATILGAMGPTFKPVEKSSLLLSWCAVRRLVGDNFEKNTRRTRSLAEVTARLSWIVPNDKIGCYRVTKGR